MAESAYIPAASDFSPVPGEVFGQSEEATVGPRLLERQIESLPVGAIVSRQRIPLWKVAVSITILLGLCYGLNFVFGGSVVP